MADKSGAGTCALPIARIKTIMKSSPDVGNIGQDSLFLIAKATELFVEDFAKLSHKLSEDNKNVEYSILADIVKDDETMQFLSDIIPPKITLEEFYRITGRKIPESKNGLKNGGGDVSDHGENEEDEGNDKSESKNISQEEADSDVEEINWDHVRKYMPLSSYHLYGGR